MAPTCLDGQVQPLTLINEAFAPSQLTSQLPTAQPAPLPSPALKPQGLRACTPPPGTPSLSSVSVHSPIPSGVWSNSTSWQDFPQPLYLNCQPNPTGQPCPLLCFFCTVRISLWHGMYLTYWFWKLLVDRDFCLPCSQLYLLYLEQALARSRSSIKIYRINFEYFVHPISSAVMSFLHCLPGNLLPSYCARLRMPSQTLLDFLLPITKASRLFVCSWIPSCLGAETHFYATPCCAEQAAHSEP